MNKVVKKMFELSKNDKFRKTRGVKWDMYFLYMGYPFSRNSGNKKKKK